MSTSAHGGWGATRLDSDFNSAPSIMLPKSARRELEEMPVYPLLQTGNSLACVPNEVVSLSFRHGPFQLFLLNPLNHQSIPILIPTKYYSQLSCCL